TVGRPPGARPGASISRPIERPAGTEPPGEWKKIGSLRLPSFFRKARRRSSASESMVPSAAIHSRQPDPHALASPRATKNVIGGGSPGGLGSGAGVPGVGRGGGGDERGPAAAGRGVS